MGKTQAANTSSESKEKDDTVVDAEYEEIKDDKK
jgi:hypothetical protein